MDRLKKCTKESVCVWFIHGHSRRIEVSRNSNTNKYFFLYLIDIFMFDYLQEENREDVQTFLEATMRFPLYETIGSSF